MGFVRVLVGVLFAGLMSCGVSKTGLNQDNKNSTVTDKKTNIVLILIDDLSHYGFTTYGASVIRSRDEAFEDITFSTPNIDALAQQGLQVQRAYTHPLCENTRVALMTGKQNNRNYIQPKALHQSEITFGDIFKEAGYQTGMFGKWKQSRGSKRVSAKEYISEFGWDEYAAFDVKEEGQRFINPNLVINGEVVDYRGRQDLDPHTGRRWYGPDIFNRHALNFIEKNKDAPFFLYYPMALVHDDHKPTPDTLPKTLFDEFDEVPHNRNGHSGDDPAYIADMIEYTDKLVGKVVKKLDDLGIRENTLIIVMGDNGTKEIFSHVLHDGSVYPARKGGNADNGIHVGMVLSQPTVIPVGKKEVRTYDGLVYVTDVLPTMMDAAKLNNQKKYITDGVSFWPQMLGEEGEPRTTIHSWFIGNAHYSDENNIFKSEFVFDKHFKRYAPSMHFPDGQFFDLRSDPLEKVGERFVDIRWGIKRYSGLNLQKLDGEQRNAYDRLGRELDKQAYVSVHNVEITGEHDVLTVPVGERVPLSYKVIPENATRSSVLWESEDTDVASVDKFGRVTAHKVGESSIHVFSWDDANPLGSGKGLEYKRSGLKDSILLKVSN